MERKQQQLELRESERAASPAGTLQRMAPSGATRPRSPKRSWKMHLLGSPAVLMGLLLLLSVCTAASKGEERGCISSSDRLLPPGCLLLVSRPPRGMAAAGHTSTYTDHWQRPIVWCCSWGSYPFVRFQEALSIYIQGESLREHAMQPRVTRHPCLYPTRARAAYSSIFLGTQKVAVLLLRSRSTLKPEAVNAESRLYWEAIH